jgi:uncharacterized glyoxalase superfamily protein PhnB
MYERFTESARKTMALALREAQRSGQENVDTEHILLGLIDQPDCSAVKILSAFQLDLKTLRLDTEKSATCIQGSAAALERPVSRAKVVLELAIEEANLGHHSVDTGHLLIGLLCEQEGGAGRILRDRGIDQEVVRARINEFSSSSQKPMDIPRLTSFERRTSMNYQSAVPVIATADVRATLEYYIHVLGFAEYFTFGDPLEYAGVHRDDVQIYVTRDEKLASALRSLDLHPDIFLWVKDVDTVYEAHKTRGAKVVEEISNRPWNARQYVIEDPNGYYIKVAEPTD